MSDRDIATTLMTIAGSIDGGTVTEPVVLMVCGNVGSGKTTKINKIINFLRKNNCSVTTVAQNRDTTGAEFTASLNRSLGMGKHTAINDEIRDLTKKITNINSKIKKISADSDRRNALSKECLTINNQIIKLQGKAKQCKIAYTHRVVIIDRTAVCKSHRTQIDFRKYNIPRTRIVAVMMTTPVETCIARKCEGLKEEYVESMTKFINSLDKMTEPLSPSEEYAAMFECNGVTSPRAKTTPIKVLRRPTVMALDPSKPNVWTAATTPSSGGGAAAKPARGGGAAKPAIRSTDTTFKPVPVDQIPTAIVASNPVRRMMGTAAVLNADERTMLIQKLDNMKTAGQLGKDALGRDITVMTSVSVTRTSQTVSAKSFRNMLRPGSQISMNAYAYVCNRKIGCLLVDISIDGERITSGHSFMTIDMEIGNTGNAVGMLNSGKYNKYKFKTPIKITGTIALILRDSNGDDEFVYDVRDIAHIMFDLLSLP